MKLPRRRTSGRRRRCGAALALILALAGCGGDDGAAPPPAGLLVHGTLTDEAGVILPGVPLAAWPLQAGEGGEDEAVAAVTGPDGAFRLGPLPPGSRFHLRTFTDDHLFWDFAADTTAPADGAPLRLALVRRHPLAAGCGDLYHERNGFLGLLMHLSKTDQTWDGRPDRRLLKWERYPVPVHVGEGVGEGGFDLAVVAREAIAAWNSALGEPCLAPVDTLPATGIRVVFAASPYLGLAELIDPPGHAINEAVPRLIRVTIDPGTILRDVVAAIVTHELGHALGLGGHSLCPQHLLYPAYAGGSARAPLPEEVAALRAAVHLPQGTPMDAYRPD